MTPAPDDFRHDAVAASVDAVGEDPAIHPVLTGLSLCLPVADPVSSITPLVLTIGGLVLGFGGIIGGALVGGAAPGSTVATPPLWLAVGGLLSITGLLCLLTPVLITPRWLRKRLGERLRPVKTENGPLVCCGRVEVEDATTFSKLKLVPEDQGYVFLDRAGGCLHVEGLRFRYTVRAEDVEKAVEVKVKNMMGLRIRFDAAGAVLDLVLKPDTPVRDALKAYGGGGSVGFLDRMRETLRPPKR